MLLNSPIPIQALKVLLEASAPGAAYDSMGGHRPHYKETCISIINNFYMWIKNQHGQCIYWLNGVAGSGKSAIAQTIAETCAERSQLIASFFFSRDKEDRRSTLRFFPTIALQLISSVPSLELAILSSLRLHSTTTIQSKNLCEQLQTLVIGPLLKLDQMSLPMVIIIDALDECEDKELAGEIITIFCHALHFHPHLPL